MIDAAKFRHFIEDVKPKASLDGMPMSLASRKAYVLRCGLVYLVTAAATEYALSNPQKLRAVRDLSNPEVESQPQRWADLFEEKSNELAKHSTPLGLLYALAGDLCASMSSEPQGDHATATDGNGDLAA